MTVAPVRGRSLTITDVAARAGVSTATVSKVMNARRGVAPPTARRVQQAIDGMGFEPSLAARRLRRGATRLVGVLFSELGEWAGEVLKGASSAAAESGHGLLAFSGDGASTTLAWERRTLMRLDAMIAGAIVIAPSPTPIVVDLPVVVVTMHGPAQGLHGVRADDVAGGILATSHLLELGHRRIAYVGRGRTPAPSAHVAGYRAALGAAGIRIDRAVVSHPATDARVARSVHALLGLAEPPTAFVAADDALALAVTGAAAAQGVAVPRELSVVGWGNSPVAAVADPAMTSVWQRPQQLGAEAFAMLLALIESGADAPREVALPAELVVRASTARPRAAAG